MMQTGLLDWQIRFKQLDKEGRSPLQDSENAGLGTLSPSLEVVRDKERKSSAGR